MSIEKTTVQHRKFIVKAGMTAEDVKNSKDATALQKKYANVFDSDGQKGFSQKEADLFNATTFSEKADGSVMFWTRQKDGTKKGTKMTGDVKDMHYATKKEVKPYVTTKKVAKKTVKQPKQEEVSFWDSKWSGHQIAKLTGDNAFTDWLQDKDKVCTDGKDDGKIGFWEGTKSLAKGLIGGIPKAVINHPVATTVTLGLGAAATALTGGAILPVLGAIGVASGVGMAGYGTYKAATAKTDGEAKQALETLGIGVTTTVLSSASAGKGLEAAQSAGVKSAEVAEDANILTKTAQMFKATPEALKVSYNNSCNYFHTTIFNGNVSATQNAMQNPVDKTNQAIQNLKNKGYKIEVQNNDIYAYNIDGKHVKIGSLGVADEQTLMINLKNAQSKGLLINLDNLDPNETYVGLQYGTDNSARAIQFATRQYCRETEPPTHVFGLSNEGGEWYIYQSNGHATPELGTNAGVNKTNATDWISLAKNQVKRFEVFKMPLNKSTLTEQIGEKYGKGDIVNLFKAFLFNTNGKQADMPGVICSEYIATSNQDIQSFFGLKPWCITPAHFKKYFMLQGVPSIE